MNGEARTLVLLAAAFCSATWSAQNAVAASSAEARITNIKILLTDLDPDDGIAPSLAFDGIAISAVGADPLALSPDRPSPEVTRSDFGSVPVFLGDTTESFALGGSTVFASTTANALVARVFTTGGYVRAAGQTYAAFYSEEGRTGFSLSPHTSFTISGDAFYSASSDGLSIGARYWENSSASVYLSIYATNGDGSKPFDPPSVFGQDYVDQQTIWGTPVTFQGARQMTVSLANTTDEVMHGFVSMDALATASVPVPEPEVLGFVSVGLLLVGSRIRLRKRC